MLGWRAAGPMAFARRREALSSSKQLDVLEPTGLKLCYCRSNHYPNTGKCQRGCLFNAWGSKPYSGDDSAVLHVNAQVAANESYAVLNRPCLNQYPAYLSVNTLEVLC